ncbi:MAG: endonuclease domain-containing protein [Sphingobacteriales bacterium JAD_PAG50586_3]|nr:MAG: endonuclease domain-containing protein [Sphingobacteriales bacterium JAD_PAG50586_3]
MSQEYIHPDHISDYRKAHRENATNMRSKGTKAEVWLWKFVLRNKQMKGYTFNRQRPIMHYIADFMCKELKLIIEVDGSIHDTEEVQAKDFVKTNELVTKGYTVLRFTNEDVYNNLEIVKNDIERVVERLENTLPPLGVAEVLPQ